MIIGALSVVCIFLLIGIMVCLIVLYKNNQTIQILERKNDKVSMVLEDHEARIKKQEQLPICPRLQAAQSGAVEDVVPDEVKDFMSSLIDSIGNEIDESTPQLLKRGFGMVVRLRGNNSKPTNEPPKNVKEMTLPELTAHLKYLESESEYEKAGIVAKEIAQRKLDLDKD